jgi:predicted nucleic acid-binding protein
MTVLVDTSVWIDYFQSGNNSEKLDFLIDENILVINDLILAELVPHLLFCNQLKIVELLNSIRNPGLAIDWNELMVFQLKCLQNGLNGIGIPDLIIAQNARQNGCEVYSLDNHFSLMKEIIGLQIT